jgi:hypothetical protein
VCDHIGALARPCQGDELRTGRAWARFPDLHLPLFSLAADRVIAKALGIGRASVYRVMEAQGLGAGAAGAAGVGGLPS